MFASGKFKKACLNISLILCSLFAVSGCSSNSNSAIKHNGQGSITATFESSLSIEEFSEKANIILNYNNAGNDYIVINSIQKGLESNTYDINATFRRLDKITINGSFYLGGVNSFFDSDPVDEDEMAEPQFGSEMLHRWENGRYEYFLNNGKYLDTFDCNGRKQVQFSSNANTEKMIISNGNEQVEVSDLKNYALKQNSRTTILAARLSNLPHFKQAIVDLPGNISYFSSPCFEKIDSNTLKITPIDVYGKIVSENAEESQYKGLIKSVIGFVTYEKTLSPFEKSLIGVGIGLFVLVLILICLGIRKHGKKTFNKANEKLIIEEICTEEDLPKKENFFLLGLRKISSSGFIKAIKRHWMLYAFLIPAIVLIVIFCYLPMFGLVIAFEDYRLEEGVIMSEFVGFFNFKQYFFDKETTSFLYFRNTIYISLIRIGTNFPLIIIFTLLLHAMRNRKAKGVVQVISYIPFFISWVAVGGMAIALLSEYGGLLNKIIVFFGGEKKYFYKEPSYWWTILAISSLWKGMGWSTLLYLASIGNINEELYDACEIDGGGKFKQALTVTIPGLLPVMLFQLILDVGSILSDNYDQILAMINGSELLGTTTNVVGILEYNAISDGISVGFSKSTTLSIVRGTIGCILVLLTNKVVKLTDNEGVI